MYMWPHDFLDSPLWDKHLIYMMSPERIGYLLLGLTLAAAVLYGLFELRARTNTQPSSQAESREGETPLPPGDELDRILASLPSSERSTFDPASIEWVPYTDGTDKFFLERPRGWEITETAHATYPEARRITVVEGQAAFTIYPRGEFDYGLPARPSASTAVAVSGRPATLREWNLPDGSWLAVATLDEQPTEGFRIELSVLNPSLVSQQILREMLSRFQLL